MLSYWKAKLCALTRPATLRIIYMLAVIVALALVAGAPYAWGSGGPGGG